MNKSFTTFTILTGLLLSLPCTACGRVALTPQLQQDRELRTFVVGVESRASAGGANESELDGSSSGRLVRRPMDDSSIQEARAMRSGWAAEGR